MPFSIYAAVLSSPLVVNVADRIPEFDVGPTCRESTVHDCLSTEKIAREKLLEAWPAVYGAGQGSMRHGRKIGRPPSYVGWLTCLQINANARNISAGSRNVSADGTTDRATTGSGETARRRHGAPLLGEHRRRMPQ